MNAVAPASSALSGQDPTAPLLSTGVKRSVDLVEAPVNPLDSLPQDSVSPRSDLERAEKLAEAGRLHQLLLSLMKLNGEIEGQGLLEQIA